MITLKGRASTQKALDSRLRRMSRNSEFIFVKPLRPILSEIRKNVIKDRLNPNGGSHVFSGKLRDSIGTEYSLSIFDGFDFKMNIKFGYFIDYGLDLEIGSPPETLPIPKLANWIKKKFSSPANTFIRARALRNQIKSSGTQAYPIIEPVWDTMKADYFMEVRKRIAKQWL